MGVLEGLRVLVGFSVLIVVGLRVGRFLFPRRGACRAVYSSAFADSGAAFIMAAAGTSSFLADIDDADTVLDVRLEVSRLECGSDLGWTGMRPMFGRYVGILFE